MKTDEWKQIVIKSPRLRNIRKGLRTVLKLAIDRKIDELVDLQELNRVRSNKKELMPAQIEKERVLSKEVQVILDFWGQSILKCSSLCESANSLDLDMTWDPIYRNWHCLKCYNYYLGTEESKRLYKKNHDDEVALWDKLAEDLES